MRDLEESDDVEETTLFEDENDLEDTLAALSIRNQRKQIRHELTDPYNRLHSIAVDADFVQAVSAAYPDFAVVPNLRCGAWYVDPAGTKTVQRNVYFKSMDGHMGEWKFPLRRPNFPFLETISMHGGAIIVDSTRRGKRFPDALSKTIPMWCAVVNRAIYASSEGKLNWTAEDLGLHTARSAVGESEKDQIKSRLDGWAQELLASSYILPKLEKPLRPFHISPSSTLPNNPLSCDAFPSFHPVICVSASRCTSGGSSERYGSFNYVPGSGDDHEGWVPPGFGPEHFWKHKDEILNCPREKLFKLLTRIGAAKDDIPTANDEKKLEDTTWIAGTRIGYRYASTAQSTHEVAASASSTCTLYIGSLLFCNVKDLKDTSTNNALYLEVPQEPKKHLPYSTINFPQIEDVMSDRLAEGNPVEIVWPAQGLTSNERDFGIGIMLVALSLHYDDESQYIGTIDSQKLSKSAVSRRLEWIITSSNGSLNPSKKILKRVNDYIFSR